MIFLEIKQLVSKFTVYQYMIYFLIALTLASASFYGFGIPALIPVIIAVVTATLLDFLVNYFKYKNVEFPQSAFISGLLIGGLLSQNLQWYVYAAAGVIAIASKHLIRFQQKHIFNPAIIGILFVSIIFGASHTWWVSSPLFLVLIFGVFIIWRLRRFDLALSFLIAYFALSLIVAASAPISCGMMKMECRMQANSASDIYYSIINGGVIYFFAMYMLTEPRTSPTARKQRIIYGVLVAVLLVIFSQYPKFYHNGLSVFFTKHDLPLALAIGNIFVPLLNKIKLGFGEKMQNPETSL